MTDCYICGHPILEGQKPGALNPDGSVTLGPDPERDLFVHFNAADHLPTAIGVTLEYKDHIINGERERAAKIVEDEVFWHTASGKHDVTNFKKDLAVKIRGKG